ncbi:hypothetical protein KDD17_14730 [Sulfitobacter albidus]|uniref:Mitochondrial inner membrane protein n=1 Tax=Sulfitobacter albidus TaxID=2829501 RepID=A0A975JGG3_9RHOB|nr:hypothetical protein KDD17_14730 [Sulfitobacter albidus]
MVLGGIIAGVIGFAVAEMDLLRGPAEDPTAELRETIAAQEDRIATLEAVEPLQIPEVDLSGLEAQLAEIDARLAEVEARPVIVAPEGIDADQAEAYIAELSGLQQAVRTQRDEIQALIENARSVEEATAEAARRADAQAALSKIIAALEAGQPYGDVLADLEAAEVTVDPALSAPAADGVPTLAALQSQFPDEARSALAASRSADDTAGVGAFLQRSLGVRSVAPREGDDPDAVLSRAEAAVQAGDLNTALTELSTLPEPGRAAIADWLSAATARTDARDAAAALSQSLTAD